LNELSLFTGAGGGLLGTHLLGWKPIGYVEYDDYCQRVIAARIRDGILPSAPIFGDIRAFINEGYADAYSGLVDVITAGFPCQAFSTAASGRNRIDQDMWPECVEVIRRVRPRTCLLENPSRKAIQRAKHDLEAAGYSCHSASISAASVGAPHIRSRDWLLANTNNEGKSISRFHDEVEVIKTVVRCTWWDADTPATMGMDDGLAGRVDRFRATGNGQVPAVVKAAWSLLNE